ncbi:hypothetical protein PsalBI1_00269 [Piscirickettsia salmonis]|nr:hypothetical protein PsalBI1_00269 [Piscirickettsia salmonis]
MLGDFASLDVQNTYRGSDAYDDTACEWIRRYLSTGDYSSKQGVGCGAQIRFNDKQTILDFIKKNPDANGIAIRDGIAPDLPMSTFYDALKRLKVTYKKRA